MLVLGVRRGINRSRDQILEEPAKRADIYFMDCEIRYGQRVACGVGVSLSTPVVAVCGFIVSKG